MGRMRWLILGEIEAWMMKIKIHMSSIVKLFFRSLKTPIAMILNA